jgi:hypothetical protein
MLAEHPAQNLSVKAMVERFRTQLAYNLRLIFYQPDCPKLASVAKTEFSIIIQIKYGPSVWIRLLRGRLKQQEATHLKMQDQYFTIG